MLPAVHCRSIAKYVLHCSRRKTAKKSGLIQHYLIITSRIRGLGKKGYDGHKRGEKVFRILRIFRSESGEPVPSLPALQSVFWNRARYTATLPKKLDGTTKT